jgi:hypothetical protein
MTSGSAARPSATKANAAGSMQTTLRDFTKFMQAVMEGKGLRHSRLM